MNRIIATTIVLVLFQGLKAQNESSLDEIFTKRLEYSMISSGDNFPDFSVKRDSVSLLLFSLHENISIDTFKKKANFDDEKLNKITAFLESKNWLHLVDGKYKPTIFA